MAGRKAGAPSRSKFIRETLGSNSNMSLEDINEAWKSAGHRGGIKGSLFYQVKSKSGLRRKGKGRRGRPRGRVGKASANGYLEIEVGLEGLVAQAETIGNKDLAEAIRTARRLASAKLV